MHRARGGLAIDAHKIYSHTASGFYYDMKYHEHLMRNYDDITSGERIPFSCVTLF